MKWLTTVSSFLKDYARIFRYARPHINLFLIALICMVIFALFTGALAALIDPMVDYILGKKTHIVRLEKIADFIPGLPKYIVVSPYFFPILMVIVAVIKGSALFCKTFVMGKLGQRVIADIRGNLFKKVIHLPLLSLQKISTGNYMSRFTYDVYLIEGAILEALTSLTGDSLMVVFLVLLAFILNPFIALIILILMLFALIPIFLLGILMRGYSLRNQEAMSDLSTLLQEDITCLPMIKSFNREKYEEERFERINHRYYVNRVKTYFLSAISSPTMEALGIIGIIGLVILYKMGLIPSTGQQGSFFSFFGILIFLYRPIKRLSTVNNIVQRALAADDRISDILNQPTETISVANQEPVQEFKASIRYDHVSFSYQTLPILQDISFNVNKGEIIGIFGPSGGGKSTLMNLLPRLYQVTRGQIIIDGVNIEEIELGALRRMIGVVSQDTILFNNSIKDNIAYGKAFDVSDELIFKAAVKANAHDFILDLECGYDTIIGERGVTLSGGQRQRIAIARAFLKNAPILILDEATSSLDQEAEKVVQKALETLMAGRTTFIITHRIENMKTANQILYIEAGQILEKGSHQELLAKNGRYAKLLHLKLL